MRLEGKTAFITAAGQGIGREIAKAFTAQGAAVTATDINADLLKDLNADQTYQLDATNKSSLQDLVGQTAPDILVNCAGFVHAGSVLDATDAEFQMAVSLNIMAMMHSIQAAVPAMATKGHGSIINIASVVSSIIGAPNRFIYGTTKAAVIGLTKSVAVDFVTQGIRVNAICPGTVDTPSLHERLAATGDYDAAHAAFVARQPMGRIATPDEIANLAVYLASDESRFVTGQAHVIDGGWAAA
ncbi:MAG: SDR family oxidoreductase [Pseudoprimorskyibacter sp.]|jgi:2-keto-3-deoxy-L-fuconate dehydrogenase|nr:SDR family oxidoreductase [Pseudoprimorskyibacter sp.]